MGRVVHFEIHAADCDRAERFYKRVARRGEADGKDAIVAFVCTIELDDSEATEAAVRKAGGEQVVDRQTMEPVGSFSYVKDPEGNVCGAMQPA